MMKSLMNKHMVLNVNIKTSQIALHWSSQKVLRLSFLTNVNSGNFDNKSMKLGQRIWLQSIRNKHEQREKYLPRLYIISPISL